MLYLPAKVGTLAKVRDEINEEIKLRKKEWENIESLIMIYKKQFETKGLNNEEIKCIREDANNASEELIKKFCPLFKKYIILLKTAQIDFDDLEMKLFVLSFVGDQSLKRALKRHKQKAEYRHQILKKFNFIKETYGALSNDEILVDLQTIFFILAKRYKQMGRNFCAYIYNTFRHEVSRHIKKFTSDPSNIPYRMYEYEDYLHSAFDDNIEDNCLEDKYYEDNMGIPDITWINGENCSDEFKCLTPLERKLLIKYYMEECNDRQIAEEFSIHINTCNQKRRQAVVKLANKLGFAESDIKRNRKSGKQAMI